MERLLGIDYGERRVGLALSDLLGCTAQPLSVLERVTPERDVEAIRLVVEKYGVNKIVIGLPLNMDGSEGESVKSARWFGGRLHDALGLEIDYIDERMTTMATERMLVEEADMSREKRKKVRDKLAAGLILQSYMDMHR